MSRTIPEVAQDANLLFNELTGDFALDLELPQLNLPTDFEAPPETGPAYEDLPELSLDALTTKTVDGTGVFDVLMGAVNSHLAEQHRQNRITGGDYAKVYLGSMQAVMQYGVQFLLSKDQARLQNLRLQEEVKLAQAQRVKALAELQIARGQIQQTAYTTAKLQLEAKTAFNAFALSKMQLVNHYNETQVTSANIKLITEQVEVQRAQTWDTHLDGTPISGLLGKEKSLIDARMQTQKEELDTHRAQTKDTLMDGTPVAGLVALEKSIKEATMVHMEQQGLLVKEQVEAAHAQVSDTKTDGTPIEGLLALEKSLKQAQQRLTEEQYDTARAQTKNTLADGTAIAGLVAVEKQTKEAQRTLVEEQVDTARAQTKDTLRQGGQITGLIAVEKKLKAAQEKYVTEQYESQRGQTRGTLSTGESVAGLIGAQTRLYDQQITSYKRDAESKGVKMLLDTWTARKTIDDGVPVPASIDTQAIDASVNTYRANLDLS